MEAIFDGASKANILNTPPASSLFEEAKQSQENSELIKSSLVLDLELQDDQDYIDDLNLAIKES